MEQGRAQAARALLQVAAHLDTVRREVTEGVSVAGRLGDVPLCHMTIEVLHTVESLQRKVAGILEEVDPRLTQARAHSNALLWKLTPFAAKAVLEHALP